MNTYQCFCKGRQLEVQASTSLEAQVKARDEFQKGKRAKIKSFEVAVILAAKEGVPVVQDGGILG